MSRRKILVIEDNNLNLLMIRDLLELAGHQVLEARDAETGLALARSQRPDLILMDVRLPGMNGLRATRTLKTDPALQHIPVVAITAHAMQGDKDKALQAGCSGYLTKPIDTRTIVTQLEHYLVDTE